MDNNEMYYSDYLQLDKILQAQDLESEKQGKKAHDEMLFIIIHQAYELWFKQIIYELESIHHIFSQEEINDNGPDLQIAVHRLERINTIFRVLVQQINIMETMTPLDFLDFRNLLRPASGFQSIQFKIVEALLGLRMEDRHGQNYYITQLREEDVQVIKEVEKKIPFISLLDEWLARMPFVQEKRFWQNYEPKYANEENRIPFWQDYRHLYEESLVKGEKQNIKEFDKTFFEDQDSRYLSAKACQTALFIMLFRDYPLMHLPFRLINALLELDEQMATWRYRHMIMVQRMIGSRIGTGGSTGKNYLKAAADKHYIFEELAHLTSFLIERRKLPHLPDKIVKQMGFEI